VLSVLAGRVGDAAGRTGLAGSDAFPDSFENEASLISPLRTVDMGESIIVLPEQGPAFIRLRLGNGIYGHSRFCNTDFDDKWACLNLSGV
ncbi:TPA: hypothetical protein ACI7DR_005133, partial [Escherichia coli]